MTLFKLWILQIKKKLSEVRLADPPISFYYTILRIGGPTLSYVYLNTISENGFGGNSFT